MKRTSGNLALSTRDEISIPRRDAPLHASPVRSLWADLERLGLGEIAMKEQVNAHRALVNATSGALTVKKKPEDKALLRMQAVLKRIVEAE